MRFPREAPSGAIPVQENLAVECYRGIVVVISGVIPTVALADFLGFGTPISAIASTLLLPAMLALGLKLTNSVHGESPVNSPTASRAEERDLPLWDRELDGGI
jgi:hypothetical protein